MKLRNPGEDVLSELLHLSCSVKPEYRAIVIANERARQEKEFMAKRPEREPLPIGGKADPLKRGHQVVGELNDFQVQAVGGKRVRGNVREAKTVMQFGEVQLNACPAIVEVPEALWAQTHVGDSASVVVAPELEQCQMVLCGSNQSSGNYMPPGF